jgi:endoglucanase
VFAVSAVQEEIGLRGAITAAYNADVKIGLAIDVTFTSDHPMTSVTELGEIKVGGGPVIDRGPTNNPKIVRRLIEAARAEGVPFQLQGDPSGQGTDEYSMQVARGGMATGLISIPTRYLHTASELLSTDDVDACVAVMTRFVRDLSDDADIIPSV